MSFSNKLTWVAVCGVAAASTFILYQKLKSTNDQVVEEQKPKAIAKQATIDSPKVTTSPAQSPAAKLTDDQYYVFIVESLGLVNKTVSRNLVVDPTLIKRLHASLELLQRYSVFTDHNQKYKDNQIIPLLVSILKDISTHKTLFGDDADSVADKAAFVLSNICLTEFFDELFLEHHVVEVMATASKSTNIFLALLQTILNISSRSFDVSRKIIKQSNAINIVLTDLKTELQPKPAASSVLQQIQIAQNTDPKEKQKRILMASKILVNFSLDEEYTNQLLEAEPEIMEIAQKLSKYFVTDIAERGIVVKNNIQAFLAKS